MRLSRWWKELPVEFRLLAALSLIPSARAFNFPTSPPSDLDISSLGSVVLAGNFDAISIYRYLGQDEDGLSPNGSQSLLAEYPTGGFGSLVDTDGTIFDVCK